MAQPPPGAYDSDTPGSNKLKSNSPDDLLTQQQSDTWNAGLALTDPSAAATLDSLQAQRQAGIQLTPAQMAAGDAAAVGSINKNAYTTLGNDNQAGARIFGTYLATIASAGIGAGVTAAAAGALGTVGGAAAGGAAAGATGTAARDAINGVPLTLGSVGKGALTGAVGGAVSAGGLSSALGSSTGLPAPLASGLVKAGVGALGSELTGGNVATGALSGGVSGLISGANTALGGNALTGAVAGAGGKLLAGAAGSFLGGGSGTTNMAATSANSGIGNIGGSTVTGYSAPTNGYGGTATGTSIPTTAGSTDSGLASTITGAIPGLLSTAAGVYGQQNAAQAQQNADNSAINTQQNTMGNIQNIWGTQQQTGQGANTALQSSLGLNGQTADPSNFLNMPGYQFAVQQGTQAIQRQAASMGNAYTPNTAEAVGQYVTGTASQDYNTYIQQLMGAAGLGTTANQGLQTGQQTTGNNISQLQQNIGQAQASGVTGAANTIAGAFGANGAGTSLLGAASKSLLGGSSGGNSTGVSGANPFAGTSLANNSGAYNAYNASNGPTASDISNSTNPSQFGNIPGYDTSNLSAPTLDSTSFDTSGMTDLSGFLGDVS